MVNNNRKEKHFVEQLLFNEDGYGPGFRMTYNIIMMQQAHYGRFGQKRYTSTMRCVSVRAVRTGDRSG